MLEEGQGILFVPRQNPLSSVRRPIFYCWSPRSRDVGVLSALSREKRESAAFC
jgi:hypothetical protein